MAPALMETALLKATLKVRPVRAAYQWHDPNPDPEPNPTAESVRVIYQWHDLNPDPDPAAGE